MLDRIGNTLRSLRAHKLRFALTSLGIVWGAFMLTYLSASLQGLDQHFTRSLQRAGPRIVFVFPGSVVKERTGDRGARAVEFEVEDVARVAALRTVENAAPNIVLPNQIVRSGGRTKLLSVHGVSSESQSIRNLTVEHGRFLSPGEIARGARVAFLGAEAAERLFGARAALGGSIQIEGAYYRVVGVAPRKGDSLVGIGGRDDRSVFVPYTTVQRWLKRSDVLDHIVFAPRTREASPLSILYTRELLGLHHDFDAEMETALTFFNIHDVLQLLHRLFQGLRIFLVAAALMTLFVGAVGVMNIMLVVVRERTPEIGLRKAVGASSSAIFLEFVAEATFVCVVSGLLGAALGVGLAHLLAAVLPAAGRMGSPPVLDPFTIGVFVGALVVVGIVAGVAPALRAARTDPSIALRAT